MQRQDGEEAEVTLSSWYRDRDWDRDWDRYVICLGTPINYRKCHFKCRESHNVHNQFNFWQICQATPRQSERESERERVREGKREPTDCENLAAALQEEFDTFA